MVARDINDEKQLLRSVALRNGLQKEKIFHYQFLKEIIHSIKVMASFEVNCMTYKTSDVNRLIFNFQRHATGGG